MKSLRMRFSLRFMLVVVAGVALMASGVRRYQQYRALQPKHVTLTLNGDQSMEPYLGSNIYFVADINAYNVRKPKRWEAVIFDPKPNATTSALRIVGLPGETVSFEYGKLFIDGQIVAVPTSFRRSASYELSDADEKHPYRVPEGCYYLLGDNAEMASDSRSWGALPEEKIVGRVDR